MDVDLISDIEMSEDVDGFLAQKEAHLRTAVKEAEAQLVHLVGTLDFVRRERQRFKTQQQRQKRNATSKP